VEVVVAAIYLLLCASSSVLFGLLRRRRRRRVRRRRAGDHDEDCDGERAVERFRTRLHWGFGRRAGQATGTMVLICSALTMIGSLNRIVDVISPRH
jgi:hypothetical protein